MADSIIGHLPREISRATRFFLLRGGMVHLKVADETIVDLPWFREVWKFLWGDMQNGRYTKEQGNNGKIQDTRNYTLPGAGTGWSIWRLNNGCIGGTVRRWLLRFRRSHWLTCWHWLTSKVDRWLLLVLIPCVKNCLGPLKIQIHDFSMSIKFREIKVRGRYISRVFNFANLLKSRISRI